MINRRKLLKGLTALPFIGSAFGIEKLNASNRSLLISNQVQRDFFKELGIRTFINAAGTYTSMTGSLMPEQVIDAIRYF